MKLLTTLKKQLLLLAVLAITAPVFAVNPPDEGMWLPMFIKNYNYAQMQKMGLKLTAEQLYDINNSSLKDAIVQLGDGFCTGEMVSKDGLMFTNHHCGYSSVVELSSVEHDYLNNGFFAMSKEEELPVNFHVHFLERMEDVTDIVLAKVNDKTTESEREKYVEEAIKKLRKDNSQDGRYKVIVKPFYEGNEYYMFIYTMYEDVRLVVAPPSAIGKFGGDTDNWMWPRHTGDFSIFRVYADKDNNPADYSPDNVPYHPKKFFKVSRAGVKEGDFTFVYGCPGSTQEYVMSEQVKYVAEISDPQKIALRTQRLDIQKKYMNQSQAVRIQYSSKNASVSNAWKKWQGEEKGIKKMHTVASKQAYEKRFREWAKGTRYEGVVDQLGGIYARRNPTYLAYEYYNETVRTIELLNFASGIHTRLRSGTSTKDLIDSFFKDYYQPIDEECFVAMMTSFDKNVPDEFKPAWFKEKLEEFGSVEACKDFLYTHSIFTDRAKVEALTPDDADRVAADPAVVASSEFATWYAEDLAPVIRETNEALRVANRTYMQGQMEFEKDRTFYPDANLTLRIAYGKVAGYSPFDAAYYYPVSTLKGIIEKDNPDIFDYNIPQVLRDIYAEGGHETQPVCFLATNHTTGGNSGSPIINADGNLIGINFDRVWEGTMSDIAYDPEICRNISLDIRYLLFVVDQIGHASYLFDEMVFVD